MFKEYTIFDQKDIEQNMLKKWEKEDVFRKSIDIRERSQSFIFYEGPPSANGKPGIHHVISRTIKDMFCRYKSLKGYKVYRKAGWDTHGLPVELSVEKTLGISKDEIGKKISVEQYNASCKKEVLRYKNQWEELTQKMAYWVDMDNPYITYDKDYIESVWWALSELYKKKLLYKGIGIQPFSPKAGTGISSHELNQPGAYRNVKDTSIVAMFKMQPLSQQIYIHEATKQLLSERCKAKGIDVSTFSPFFLAWTTTPWTLPSNLGLAVNPVLQYAFVECYNLYTKDNIIVCLADDLIFKYFDQKQETHSPLDVICSASNTNIWRKLFTLSGKDMENVCYEQLFPYVQPDSGKPFRVVLGNFVTVEEGTGIVHTAPAFGADDFVVGKKNNLGFLNLVNEKGKFIDGVGEFSGRYIKNYDDDEHFKDVNVDIAVKLKKEGRAFKIEKFEHSYPHCWRTDKPIIYYPMDSWFIKTTACTERLVELNRTIQWKPASTGTGRFENWLENLVDWNLSRSRFWGVPLPIWREENGDEEKCIGSFEELQKEYHLAKEFNSSAHLDIDHFDPHKPFIDAIYLKSSNGKRMVREKDLIDVWFDSGSMPFAQLHYPFENQDLFKDTFPADFICEGVDQTRGWFFTLHVIATMLFDSVAYKHVVSNGLVLDKKGNKMSKRLGNVVDPFETINTYGADVVRWYLITNALPWDNLKFNIDGVIEVRKKFFGTLFNTYQFFVMYANVDKFTYQEAVIPIQERPDFDQWIISRLHNVVDTITKHLDKYEPTQAYRYIETFVDQDLSNWYVRLSRRRFWKGEFDVYKISAYQTLYDCLETISILIAPIAPFFADWLFQNLNSVSKKQKNSSVHLLDFPVANKDYISKALETRYSLAQEITSMILFLRKKENIRVRQPLQKVSISFIEGKHYEHYLEQIEDIVKNEVNVKQMTFIDNTSVSLSKKVRPNFQILGKKLGKTIKAFDNQLSKLRQEDITEWEKNGDKVFDLDGQSITIRFSEVEVKLETPQGISAKSNGEITVFLDTIISKELEAEGFAKELINIFQKVRKERNYNLTDRIKIFLAMNNTKHHTWIKSFEAVIKQELLATELHYTIPEPLNKNEMSILGEKMDFEIDLAG